MKKLLLLVAAFLSMQMSSAYAADMKPYIGVGLGIFELDPGQNKQTAFGGFGIFGIDFHDNFAVEARAGSTGPHEREELGPLTETFKVNWFASLLAKPKIEIADSVEVYGLVGLTSMSSSITPANSNLEQTATKTALSFGLGGSYDFNDQMSVGAEWARYSTNADASTKNTAAFKGLDVNGFTATGVYRF